MQNRKWLYYLLDEFGKSYRIENGFVVAKNDPFPLRYTPDGWQDISIGWERSFETHGTTRNFTLPYHFVRDGLDILRDIFYTKNFEYKLFLLLKKQELFINNTEFYFWHKYFYKGQLDLISMQDETNKGGIEIKEGGLHKDIEANEGTKYQTAVNVPEALLVKMDGIDLLNKASFLITEDEHGPGNNGYFPMMYALSDGVLLDVELNTELIQWRTGAAIPDLNSPYWFIKNPSTKSINLSFEAIKLRLETRYLGGVGRGFSIVVRKYNPNGVPGQPNNYTGYVILYSINEGAGTHTINEVTLTGSITLNPGERAEFMYEFISNYTGQSGAGNGNFTGNTMKFFSDYFNVTSLSRFDPTYIKVLPPLYVFLKWIEKLTGNASNGSSQLLNKWRNLCITSGDAIRNIPGAAVKITYNDLIKAFDVVMNSGTGIKNGKVIVEEKKEFYDFSDPIHLGKIKEPVVTYFKEIICNTVKIGYPDQDYKDVNGRQEFNTTSIFSTPVKSVVKELDKVSPIRADPFGIEFLRVNMEGKTTTDNESDNDVFFINIDIDNPQVMAERIGDFPAGTVYYNLKRETYDSIEGLISPSTLFNIVDLSPARLMKRMEGWLRSIFHGFEGDYLKYQTSDKNSKLKTVKGSVIFDEDADILIQSLKNPIVIPRAIDFKTLIPVDLVEIMEANPNRCFSIEHPNGNIYKGFNVKVGIAPNTLEEQAYQLLFTPDTDLTTLRNG